MRFVDFQVMTFFVGKRPLEERGRCILGCQKFSNGAPCWERNVMVKADFIFELRWLFRSFYKKPRTFFFSKMSAFPSIFPPKNHPAV